MKLLPIFFTAILVSVSVFAAEVKVCKITADIDPQIGNLFVEMVKGRADSLRVITNSGNKILSDDSYPVEKLLGREGIVASERSGHNIIIVRLENFNPLLGGIVVMDYLYNGITKNRKKLRLKFFKEGKEFVLRNLQGEKVNHLHFKGHRILRKVVGLKNIEVSFK